MPTITSYTTKCDLTEGWPRDVWGTVADLRQLGNGTVSLTVDAGGQPIRVRGLSRDPERHPALTGLAGGSAVAIFELSVQGGTNTYAEGPYTVIYPAKSCRCVGAADEGAQR